LAASTNIAKSALFNETPSAPIVWNWVSWARAVFVSKTLRQARSINRKICAIRAFPSIFDLTLERANLRHVGGNLLLKPLIRRRQRVVLVPRYVPIPMSTSQANTTVLNWCKTRDGTWKILSL
jgi:hypothetical protein